MSEAHVHLILNHIPVLGTLFGIALLTGGLAARSTPVRMAGLVAFVLSAVAALAAYLTGEPAEHLVEKLPGVSGSVIERHEAAATVALAASLLAGAAALASLLLCRFRKPTASLALAAVLVLAVASAGTMSWTANLGGQIRHTEIRASGGDSPVTQQQGRDDEREHDD